MTTLALLRMAVSGAMAEPITIIWTSSNGSFDDRVEYSNGPAFNVDMKMNGFLKQEEHLQQILETLLK